MAALLRSVRLLKFSPSGLLQISGTKRTGPALSRLYSAALGGSGSGVRPRQISPASGNASSSRVWPHALGCVRTYAMATEKEEINVAVQSKQAQEFDWALAKLDSSVRRTGRITKVLLLRIFHDICRKGYPSGNQALLLLRSCGSLLPEVPLEERNELAHRVWEKLQELGARYDASHYNALLKVYLQNEFKFSPTDFLAKMEEASVQPNRVTYQRLLAAYCQNGDIEGASTILGFMKSQDLPITEAVFSSLLTGHARAGDIESAKNILTVMEGAGIEPGPDTYVALLNAYAAKGDMDSLKQTLESLDSAECSLMHRDMMQVIFTLAKAGHQQLVPEILQCLKHERGYIPDAMNLCLSLITQGLDDTAFHILKTIPSLQFDNLGTDSPNLGNFFLRHCVNMDMSVEKLALYCKELQESDLHTAPLSFALSCALQAKKTGMSFELMKILKEQDLPIRPHYFWPLLTQHVKDNNTAGVVEVFKGMQELGVSPDMETLSSYILPVFPSMEAAQQALEDAGVSWESEGFLSSEIRMVAVSNLDKLYCLLSDPSLASLDLNGFRGQLIQGFRKSNDVEIMVKITELLFRDERFCKEGTKPAENASTFLYRLINSMSDKEVQAQENKLQKYFHQLKAQNISISVNIYRGIRNLLESYQVPELIKDVIALVGHQEVNGSMAAVSNVEGNKGKILALEKKLAKLKMENKPLSLVLKQLIHTLCAEENLQQALELKQQHEEEMTIGSYVTLLNLCCRHDKVEEALNLKREISQKDPSFVMDGNKYIALVRTLSTSGKVEEAVDILKEMKEREMVMDSMNATMLFHAFNAVAAMGDVPTLQRLQDTVFTLGLIKPNANLCSPLISAYLDRKDLPGALQAVMEFHKHYKHLPRIHDVIVGLVEKGDTEQLQIAMDFVSQEQGEMTMLYFLLFAFLQTGRYREARKIIETPGLRARPGRLRWFAERCISVKQMEPLEEMVDMTAKLFECDRDEMYCYILRLCKETNDWKKAESVWTKMQEENVVPRERTLHMLADILKKNNQEVPFEVPETWYEQAGDEQNAKPAVTPTTVEGGADKWVHLMALCKRGKVQEAYGILKDADKKGVVFGPAPYDHVIRALLAVGSLKEAMEIMDIAVSRIPSFRLNDIASNLLIITHSKKGQSKDALERLKSMLSENQMPSQFAVNKLVQSMGSHGDVEGIQVVESLVKDLCTSLNLSSMLFVNNTALAHIKNGDLESAVEVLEEVVMRADGTRNSIAFVFRRMLEEGNDEALDKLSAMAERLANHFARYTPAADLFLQLLEKDRVEDAKGVLARCNGVAELRGKLVSFLAQKAQTPGQMGKIKNLLSLIPDFCEKNVLYSYMMKCHFLDNDLSSAKALYEQMQKEEIVVDELSLKRLAVLYRNEGEVAPFTEPPESFKFYANKLRERTAAQAEE